VRTFCFKTYVAGVRLPRLAEPQSQLGHDGTNGGNLCHFTLNELLVGRRSLGYGKVALDCAATRSDRVVRNGRVRHVWRGLAFAVRHTTGCHRASLLSALVQILAVVFSNGGGVTLRLVRTAVRFEL
jgi:hypothetical protein